MLESWQACCKVFKKTNSEQKLGVKVWNVFDVIWRKKDITEDRCVGDPFAYSVLTFWCGDHESGQVLATVLLLTF